MAATHAGGLPTGAGQPGAAGAGSGARGFDFDREWPFFPDEEKLRIFEPRANVAILIGHSVVTGREGRLADPPLGILLSHLPAAIPAGSIAAIGTIATLRDGVERVVQNLLTNPYITVLFLCGEDSPVFYPLEGLACLYRNGVDDTRHVVPSEAEGRAARVFRRDALATLSHDDIACFRGRPLTLVDCRGPLEPAAFFAEVTRRLPDHRRPVAEPSWSFLDAIDVYRWRPRVLQVGAGTLPTLADIAVSRAGRALVLRGAGRVIVATGKPDGRAQRAVHTALRLELIDRGAGWEERLIALALAAERAVLATEFPDDAVRAGIAIVEVPLPVASEEGRLSPLALDPRGFFKIQARYEQGLLAADHHAADGRHVETLLARRAEDLLAAIAAGSYVGPPPARAQHLVYLAVQIGRADFALRTGLLFEEGQPLSAEARKNVDHHLAAAAVIAGGSLEETWIRGLANLREQGLLTTTQKGRVTEGWGTFFVIPGMAEIEIPAAYPASEEDIARYADELLAPAPEVRARGDYTYGDRTCHYFFDQVAESGRQLAADPDRVCLTQRWVPDVDLPAAARHRPCLVFDLWFRHEGRLHVLEVARSHDVYGGLPQNALGIARSWGRVIATTSGLPLGDLCFLSISNNFRVGDDADNVRRAVQRGVSATSRTPTFPLPVVARVTEDEAAARLTADPARVVAVLVEDPRLAPAPGVHEVLRGTPLLARRLLRYGDRLDQVQTVVDRLRAEVGATGRARSNSLVLSPRDPLVDRAGEATPLVCLQLRRQLGRLHAAAVVLGDEGARLAPVLFGLQRAIAAGAEVPLGSMMIVRVATRG